MFNVPILSYGLQMLYRIGTTCSELKCFCSDSVRCYLDTAIKNCVRCCDRWTQLIENCVHFVDAGTWTQVRGRRYQKLRPLRGRRYQKLRPLRGRSYPKLRPSCVHMWTGTLLGHTMIYMHYMHTRTYSVATYIYIC